MLIFKPATAANNNNGQLGYGDTETHGDNNNETGSSNEMGDFLPAVSLGVNMTASAVTCGYAHTCALLSNGQLKCWGGSQIILSLL